VTIEYRIMLTSDGLRHSQSHEPTFATSKAAEDECHVLNAGLGATPKMKWIVVEDVQDRGGTARSHAKRGLGSRRR
jgi:hypothetical protein